MVPFRRMLTPPRTTPAEHRSRPHGRPQSHAHPARAGAAQPGSVGRPVVRSPVMGKLPVVEVPIVDYGEAEAAMVEYRRAGEARAMALGNRGPLVIDDQGRVDPAVLDAYERTGFYVFEGVL